MSRKLIFLLTFVACVAALAWYVHRVTTRPPEVPFTKVVRETLVSTLTTNGKAEPSNWVAVRSEIRGLVDKVYVQRGQQVSPGSLIAQLQAQEARSALATASAQVLEAEAQLQTLKGGGRAADVAEIDNALARARMDLSVAERDYQSLQRLSQKNAATRQEVFDAQQRVKNTQAQIQALERKRAALVTPADVDAAEARLKGAAAKHQAAREQLAQSTIRSPIAGSVYELEARPGAFLEPGGMVAKVGVVDKLRVLVYVDEPELGRLAEGMPVTITWDALPGRQWKGTVQQVPTAVVPLGTRQVGEVFVTIDNPNRELLPGTNVNVEIQAEVVQNGLVIPKEAIRRQDSKDGVYLLDGDRVSWKPVTVGASSVTRVQVVSGLKEGDSVALGTEQALENGARVRPVYR